MLKLKCTLIFFMIFSSIAQAQEAKVRLKKPPTPVVEEYQPFGLSAGYQYSSFVYDEPRLMSYHGHLSGVVIGYDRTVGPEDLDFKIDFEYLAGDLVYDGSLWTGEPITSVSRDTLINARTTMGKSIELSHSLSGGPYAGVGIRYLDDQMKGIGSYEREISYLYVPVGARGEIALSLSGWKIGGALEYDLFLAGKVKSHLSQTSPDSPDIENNQSNGEGARLVFDLSGTIGHVSMRVQPYFQYWHIRDSDTAFINSDLGYGLEPDNTTKQYGVNVVLGI